MQQQQPQRQQPPRPNPRSTTARSNTDGPASAAAAATAATVAAVISPAAAPHAHLQLWRWIPTRPPSTAPTKASASEAFALRARAPVDAWPIFERCTAEKTEGAQRRLLQSGSVGRSVGRSRQAARRGRRAKARGGGGRGGEDGAASGFATVCGFRWDPAAVPLRTVVGAAGLSLSLYSAMV